MTMVRAALLILMACLFLAAPAMRGFAAQPVAAPPPEKLEQLNQILNDPAVGAWIKTQVNTKPTSVAKSAALDIESWETRVRSNFHALIRALPTVPAEYSAAVVRIHDEAENQGFAPVIVILAAVVIACLLAEWAIRRLMSRMYRNNPVAGRAYAELVPLAAFVLVGAAAFFSVEWPPLTRITILVYLLAAIGFRIVAALAAVAVSAGSFSPFMFRRILVFSGILLFALATDALAEPLSINPDVRFATSIFFSIVLLALCCEAEWRRPAAPDQTIRTRLLHILYFILVWMVWVVGFRVIFWLGVYAVLLPAVIPAADRLTKAFAAARWNEKAETGIRTILLVHGVRTIIIILAVVWLAVVWHYNPRALGRGNPFLTAVTLGLFKSMIVLIVADLGWTVAKTLINRKLASVSGDAPSSPEEMARQARLRTLLPIFRNALAALLLVITGLTVLAELGVEVGPLIAGAGIFGVALGFGSQTLVKDVISGVFYLMDDAFRIGEYIQSGSYKGTVESFSLRSVRLRHHRGPVFTVPFGELGAVQNMSRDWSIDKFMLRVGFDTDVAVVKKLVKAIGAQLREDPELGPLIIETLKMKGVEQIGDYGIELSFAFTAVPGHISMIRRRAYVMIREAFADNGIDFAQPTVQVGGEGKPDAAAAALSLAQKKQAAEQAAAG